MKMMQAETTLQFRKALPQDAGPIKVLAQRVARHNYIPFLGAEMVSAFIDGGMSDQEIDDGLDGCTVMLSGGCILGFAITKADLLHLIMVDVPFQGNGYGGKLLEHTERELFQTYAVIRLQSFRQNAGAVRFYLRKGWHVIAEEAFEETGTMLTLEKTRT